MRTHTRFHCLDTHIYIYILRRGRWILPPGYPGGGHSLAVSSPTPADGVIRPPGYPGSGLTSMYSTPGPFRRNTSLTHQGTLVGIKRGYSHLATWVPRRRSRPRRIQLQGTPARMVIEYIYIYICIHMLLFIYLCTQATISNNVLRCISTAVRTRRECVWAKAMNAEFRCCS